MAPTIRLQRGQTLIGLLLTLMIILILGGIFYTKIAAVHSAPGEPRTPLERAEGAGCAEYQSQLNEALEMYKTDHDDRLPHRIEALKQYGVTDDEIYASGCYFVIDPNQGMIVDKGLSQVHPQEAPDSYYSSIRARNHAAWSGGSQIPSGFHPDDSTQGSAAPPAQTAVFGEGGGRRHSRRYNSGDGQDGSGSQGFASGPSGQDGQPYTGGGGQIFGGNSSQGQGGAQGGQGGQGQDDDSGDNGDGGGGGNMNLRPTAPPRIGPGGIPLPTAGY